VRQTTRETTEKCIFIDVYPVESLSEAKEHLLRDIEALNLSIKLPHVRLQMSRLIQHLKTTICQQ